MVLAAILVSVLMLAMLACSPESVGSGDIGTATGSPGSGNSRATDLPISVDVAAPVESVEIVKLTAKSPNASLFIVSGGLNSCDVI